MKILYITLILLISTSLSFSSNEELYNVEVGDEEMYIGYDILDTPYKKFPKQTANNTISLQSSGGGVNRDSQIALDIDLEVIDNRYESGDEIFGELRLNIPKRYLEKNGYFEYYLKNPNGNNNDIKRIRIEDSENKIVTYKLKENSMEGDWEMIGNLKLDGYSEIQVSDSFKVQNYTIFIWYLLTIIVFTSLTLLIYTRRKNKIYS